MQFVWDILIPIVLALHASCQAFHTVTVGFKGSFYDPATLNALKGDVVTFVFVGDGNTVTQSSFERPCSPLPGGFDSGFLGTMANSSIASPTWDLVISNASTPIWFFCEATQPQSHCAAGMVGSINVPAEDFVSFQAAAKTVSGTPSPHPTIALSGVGAFATASPTTSFVMTSTQTASGSSSSLQSASSAPATPSASPPKKSVPVGAIAGGVIAGCLAVALLVVVLILLRRRKREVPQAKGGFVEKECLSQPTFRRRPGTSESVTSSDISDSDLGRPAGQVHRQPSTARFSRHLEAVDREPTRQIYNSRSIDAFLNADFTRANERDFSTDKRRRANTQSSFEPSTLTDVPEHSLSRSRTHFGYNDPPSGSVDLRTADFHELAKEVAELLVSGNPTSPGPPLRSIAPSNSRQKRPSRALPHPRLSLREESVAEVPDSPGLPRYER